ncbi:hypothetical protein D0Z08_31095 [Nocardioides immobilis]|uniref:Polysaccharide biosynthesis protein n=1 Tax=Nocardioides immobilis TaxID=2049295 RepID=A0A417XRU7_9ACTN|nr:hypothetical protein [Nocardioides immobilis]RHW22790.1 hypothetical protein D0Z08_31095 [Nocardioides immobilis]
MSVIDSRTTRGTPDPHGPARRSAATSSVALIASAIGTAATTYLFWVVVARRDGADAVGAAAAQIATITFLGSAASLNLTDVLARFLPHAGEHTGRLIGRSYLAAGCAAALVAVAFLATPWGSAASAGVGVVGFVGLVVLSAIFLIQDGGLIGLGKAAWVPIENVTMGVARLALLPVCALLVATSGYAVLAWGIAMGAAVVALNAIVLGRLAPRARGRPRLPEPRSLRRFVAVESVNTAVTTAVATFLPAVVTFSMGPRLGGYFYVPWMLIAIGTLLLSNVLITAVRESVADPAAAPSVLRGQLRLEAALVATGTAGCVLLPQVPLALLGSDFAQEADGLLRWLGLALPGTAVLLLFWALCLIRQRPWPLLLVNVAVAVCTLGAVVAWGEALGLAGVGVVYCAVQTAAALAVLPVTARWLKPMLHPHPPEKPGGEAS